MEASMYTRKILVALGILAVATSAAAIADFNFGEFIGKQLDAHSQQLFGIVSPVPASSTESISKSEAEADPTALVTLSKHLRARVVSAKSNLGPNIDMMALWPNSENPSHLIACNEEGTAQPGVQRIKISDGTAETILTGTNSCDPVRRTAWGTIIVGEEDTTGWLIEIINPLATTNVTFNRGAGTFSGGVGAGNLAVRPALGRLAFEGLALYPNGVLYYGDENRPLNGTPGGAYFKFVPAAPWGGGSITSLAQSPLAAGSIFGL